MPFSVDDLVASLSNNHIGQEAIDLAALHAQLAQAIVAQQSGFSLPTKPVKPCTTPTSATMPYSWNHVSPMAMVDDMEYQDERMVEELLIPCSQTPTQAQTQTNPEASFPAIDPPAPSSPSLFTSTDPFYIAQLRETQTRFRGSSWCDGQVHAYAHATEESLDGLGRPDEASPFLRVAQAQAQVQAQAQAPHHQQQAPYQQQQQQQQLPYQRNSDVGNSYSAAQCAELLYQLEQMYHLHHYYPPTAVET